MKRFNKKNYKITELSFKTEDVRAFYKMLLKFEKRHPDFNAKKMIQKLYPTLDLESIV